MMKYRNFGFSLLAGGLLWGALAASAAVPEGYYDKLNGLTGRALRQAAREVVYDHTVIAYGDDTWEAFAKTDVRVVNGVATWWDMYSPNNVAVSSGKGDLNIEHSVANSWWGGTKNAAYKDLHHLNPSNSTANNRKSNFPLGEVAGTPTWTNGVTIVGNPVSGQGGGSKYVYEPCDEYKGDFARVFMYMFTTYETMQWNDTWNWMFEQGSENMLRDWAIDLILKWHRQDPVSQKEVDRNEAIYGIQHNRNPYIDSPELAEYVWGVHKGEPYSYDGSYVPGEDPVPTPGPGDDPEPTPTPEVPAGTWTLVSSAADLIDGASYMAVASKSLVAMNTTLSSTYFQKTDAVGVSTVNGVKTIASAPSDAAILKIERSSLTNYQATISTVDGTEMGYLSSSGAKKVAFASQPGADCNFTLSIDSGVATMKFGSNGTFYYNASAPRFTTYTSVQEAISLYRFNPEEKDDDDDDISTGIEEIAEATAPTAIFTLQGERVHAAPEELPAGIYIVVTPGQPAQKILKR